VGISGTSRAGAGRLTQALGLHVASVAITIAGKVCTCTTSLVANNRGPVVVIEVTAEAIRRGRVGIFPPYSAQVPDGLDGASHEELQQTVLDLFIAEQFEITVPWILDYYDAVAAQSSDEEILEVKSKTTFYVHPKQQA
jgi:hypothetical protein